MITGVKNPGMAATWLDFDQSRRMMLFGHMTNITRRCKATTTGWLVGWGLTALSAQDNWNTTLLLHYSVANTEKYPDTDQH